MSDSTTDKKQKNCDGKATSTQTSIIPNVSHNHTNPINLTSTTTMAATAAAPVATVPVAVTYGAQLQVELADEKLLTTFPMFQCWGCRSLVWECEVPPCLHLACKGCVNGFFADGEKEKQCPTCKAPLTRNKYESVSLTKHLVLQRMLSGLQIKCPMFQHMGCKAVIEYSEAKSHLEKTCEYSITECEFCFKPFKTCEMVLHGQSCKRWMKCPDCKTKLLSDQLPTHQSSCMKKLILCTNACGTLIKREHIDQHRESCPLQLLPCPIPFCPQGKIPRQSLLKHVSDETLHHGAIQDACWQPSQKNTTDIKTASGPFNEALSGAMLSTITHALTKSLCLAWKQSVAIKAASLNHRLPISFCPDGHPMSFAVAPVNEELLPLCISCGDQLEPRQTHFVCETCQIHCCPRCYTRIAIEQDEKTSMQHQNTTNNINNAQPPPPPQRGNTPEAGSLTDFLNHLMGGGGGRGGGEGYYRVLTTPIQPLRNAAGGGGGGGAAAPAQEPDIEQYLDNLFTQNSHRPRRLRRPHVISRPIRTRLVTTNNSSAASGAGAFSTATAAAATAAAPAAVAVAVSPANNPNNLNAHPNSFVNPSSAQPR